MPRVHPSSGEERRQRKLAYMLRWQKEHRAERSKYGREWRVKHRPILLIRNRCRHRWKRLIYPEQMHAIERRHHIKKKYRMTQEEFAAMLESQGGVCAICGQPETRKNRSRYLCVDHEHDTDPPKVRGLLCHGCNSALGSVKENVQTLRAMIAYIERHGNNPEHRPDGGATA